MVCLLVVEPPTLLEMFGFSFFFGTVLTGPQFTLARYRKFVNGDLIPTKKFVFFKKINI